MVDQRAFLWFHGNSIDRNLKSSYLFNIDKRQFIYYWIISLILSFWYLFPNMVFVSYSSYLYLLYISKDLLVWFIRLLCLIYELLVWFLSWNWFSFRNWFMSWFMIYSLYLIAMEFIYLWCHGHRISINLGFTFYLVFSSSFSIS